MDSLLSRICIHIFVGPLDPHHTYIARVTHCVPSPMWILNDVDTTLWMQDISCFLGKPVREWRSYHQQQMLTVVYPQLTIFFTLQYHVARHAISISSVATVVIVVSVVSVVYGHSGTEECLQSVWSVGQGLKANMCVGSRHDAA